MPKLRATEITGKVDQTITIVVQKFGTNEQVGTAKKLEVVGGNVIDVTER